MRPICSVLLLMFTMPIVVSAQDSIDEVRQLADHPTLERAFEIIEDLERQFPGFRDRVIENGDLTGSIAVSVNGEISTEGLHEFVPAESEIHFVPAIGGG